MVIEFGISTDPVNKVNKAFNVSKSVTGKLTGGILNTDPIITVADFDLSWNYCHIPSVGRYYFINRVELTNNKLFRVYMHVDVLKTYSSQLESNIEFYNSHAKTDIEFNDVFAKSNNILVTIKSV